MRTTAIHNEHYTETHATEPVFCLSPLNCVKRPGSSGSPRGLVKTPREGQLAARHQARLLQEVAPPKKTLWSSLKPRRW